MAKDPEYKEKGGKGYIKNPDGSINETNYANAMGDLNAAAAIITKFYPKWREEWLSNGKLKRGSIPKLKGIIDKVEHLPELRRKEDDYAILIDESLAWANSDPAEALEGLKIMEREWQKLSNLDRYGQKPAYKRNIELDQIEKNAPKRIRPPPPPPGGDDGGDDGEDEGGEPPPPPPPEGGDRVVLSVHVEPDNAGRTSPRDGEVHRYNKNSVMPVQQRPNKGYVFDHWVLDGTSIAPNVAPARIAADGQSVIDVTMDRNHTVFAVFTGGEDTEKTNLIVDSTPFQRVRVNVHHGNVQISGGPGSLTPISIDVQKNTTYSVTVPEKVTEPRSGKIFHFTEWEDGSKQGAVRGVIQRLVYIKEPTRLVAKYDALTLTVDSRPMRNVGVKINDGTGIRLMDRGVTRAREYVEEGKTYYIEVPETFLAPDGKTYTFEKWEDGPTNSKRQVLMEDEIKTIIADYKEPGKVTHTQRPVTGSPYRSGMQRPSDRLTSALGMSGFKGKIERDTKARDLYNIGGKAGRRDPHLLAAVNKGKRIHNKYGRLEYTRIFGDFREKWKDRKETLSNYIKTKKQQIKNSKTAAKNAKAALSKLKKTDPGHAVALATYRQALANLQQAQRDLLDLRINFEKEFSADLENRSASIANVLNERSGAIAITVSRRYQIPINSDDQAAVSAELETYAKNLAEQFATRGRTYRHAFMRGLGVMSRGTETFGAFGQNVLGNTVDFIFGPWTFTTLFVLLQFFFVLTYVGYNLTYLWIFPIIGAGFAFILNFSDSFRPLDWVTHLSSGAIIGYSSMLLLIALGALSWSFMSTFVFWIIWAILGFLGLFQFYQTGGWKVVMQGGGIILLFAYVALGPYSAYYQQALDQVKTPVEIAFRAVSGAVTDVWLLATNPTEWHAKQQLVNVRPAHPIDFPKGIEVSLLDALPPSVPAQSEFAITAVIKNEGSIKEPARDITVTLGCNQFCNKPPPPDITQNTYRLCNEGSIFSLSSTNLGSTYYCAESCGSDTPDPNVAGGSLQTCVDACNQKGNSCGTKSTAEFTSNYFFANSLDRGEARSISIRGFKALNVPGKQAQAALATVLFNLSYHYSTTSSLLTEVMAQDEINRRIQNNENIYRNVLAVAKSSPAQLSLNVGPQPLTAGQKSLLLVSVSNTRDDSSVVLQRGTKIVLTMPKVVGSGLVCGGSSKLISETAEKEIVEYTVSQEITVLPYDFQSIFAFLCDFTAAPDQTVGDVKTGLVTAELPDYTFVLAKEKSVPITPKLGIIFDPYESTCNECGDGTFESCDTQQECYAQDKQGVGACWYEFSDKPGATLIGGFYYDRCHSCARFDCSRFITRGDCESTSTTPSQAGKCGLSCRWDTTQTSPSIIEVNKKIQCGSGDPLPDGLCVKKVITRTSVPTGPATGACNNVPASYRNSYQSKYKDIIATQVDAQSLGSYVGGTQAAVSLVSAIISQESGWNERALGDGGNSVGLMQINVPQHLECNSGKLRAFDAEENIRCGVGILVNIAKTKDINTPKTYACKNVQYSGVDAILRYYNGWPSTCAGDKDYVENVKSGSGNYNNWLACFQPSSTGTVAEFRGDQNYCQALFNAGSACDEYQGGCRNDGECRPIAAGPNPPQRLACRTGLASVGICCYPTDDSTTCLKNFNEWRAGAVSYFSGTVYATSYIDENTYQTKIAAKAPSRSGAEVSYIVLHHSVSSSIQDTLSANVRTGTNEHYIVDKDGTVVSVVPETLNAQHANCMNGRSVGIEIINEGDNVDQYTSQQLDSLRNLVSYLIGKYNIQQGHLIGHGCTNTGKLSDEPTGLDPNFLSGWTVVKRSDSTAICSPIFCDPNNPSVPNLAATI